MSEENIQTTIMTHVALVSLNNDVDATPAPSYEAALEFLRSRAETWDWDIDPEHPLDRSTATLEQLSELYAHNGDEATWWVNIAELMVPCMVALQPNRSLCQ
jgi:hypothetical protein